MKLCLECKQFIFDGGCAGFSDVTPGYNASFLCRSGKYHEDAQDVGETPGLRELLRAAETCDDYDPDPDMIKIGKQTDLQVAK